MPVTMLADNKAMNVVHALSGVLELWFALGLETGDTLAERSDLQSVGDGIQELGVAALGGSFRGYPLPLGVGKQRAYTTIRRKLAQTLILIVKLAQTKGLDGPCSCEAMTGECDIQFSKIS